MKRPVVEQGPDPLSHVELAPLVLAGDLVSTTHLLGHSLALAQLTEFRFPLPHGPSLLSVDAGLGECRC